MDISSISQSAVNQVLPTVGLDTVRALHQTVVSLRSALENSQSELSRLKDKIKNRAEYRDAIAKLSIENHILRRQVIDEKDNQNESDEVNADCMEETNQNVTPQQSEPNDEKAKSPSNANLTIPTIELQQADSSRNNSEDEAKNDQIELSPERNQQSLDIERDLENLSLQSMSDGDNSVFIEGEISTEPKINDSENDSEEVDDIELIFTTEETKGIDDIQEDLVSISDAGKWRPGSSSDTPVLINFKMIDFDAANEEDLIDDDVFTEHNPEDKNYEYTENKTKKHKLVPTSEGSLQKSVESTDSFTDSRFESRSLEKDESFDQFDEREKRLQKMWSQCSVLVETDISKCGVLDDSEVPNLANRRNTCPNPLAYRPIIHRDALLKTGRPYNSKYLRSPRNSLGVSSIRPILHEKTSPKAEAEAQTEISALPSPWKSESYLAHKVAHQFTTLPSKFALPICNQPRIRLSEKTQEARRVLLSDINFTSMVPELSRSADHLCQEGIENHPPTFQTYTRGPFLKTPEIARRNDLTDSLTSPNFSRYYSPSDYSNFGSGRIDSSNQFMNRYKGSLTSINSPSQYELSGRTGGTSYWKQNCPTSFDSSRGAGFYSRSTFGSVPTSPTRHRRSRSVPHVQKSIDGSFSNFGGSKYHFGRSYSRPASQWGFGQRNKTRSRVTFEDTNLRYNRTNHSLPDLRSDSYDSGGDSTDSLVEEAEHYLRRSIDCMISGTTAGPFGYPCENWKAEKSRARRASAPDPIRETDPPSGSTPYLPRGARDLRIGHWVKIIGPEGRVRGGRIRYIGPIMESPSQTQNVCRETSYIGVELATSTGNSDGSYQGRRFFDCEPDHAVFVPFKKVIMAWST